MTDYSELLKDLPDNETLLDVDNFLTGEAAYVKDRSDNHQLMGISSSKDLKKFQKLKIVDEEVKPSDLDEWESLSSIPESFDPLEVFSLVKRACFEPFGFLLHKSKQRRGFFKEEDLILEDTDRHLLDFLEAQDLSNYSRVFNLAQLSAYTDMQVERVRLSKGCGCALCKVLEGSIFRVTDISHKLGIPLGFIHSNCVCEFIPIFDQRLPYFPTTENLVLDHATYKNLPLEYKDEILEIKLPVATLEFQDFSVIEDWQGEVTHRKDDKLFIHSGYVGSLGPLDYLMEWVKEDEPQGTESSDEVLYFNGMCVKLQDGNYIDIQTGEIIDL